MKPRAAHPAPPERRLEHVAAPPPSGTLWIALPALMLAMMMASLDQSIVNTALPRISSDLGGLSHISWVVTGFMLTSTIAAPLYGKLSDLYGRRRLFVEGICLFMSASALCGAQSMTQLIACRAAQGLGAGGLMTLSQAAIGDLVGPQRRGRYQGIFTSALAISAIAGPLIGGGLTTALSWRWVFYVNLPVGIIALGLIHVGFRHRPLPTAHRIDFAGALLLAAATAAALVLLSWGGSPMAWWSWRGLGLLSLSALLFALFIRQEARAPEPLMDLALFRIRSFSIGIMIGGAMGFATMSALVFLPLYFQLVLGLDPARAGLMMLPQIGAMIVSSILGGQLSSRWGHVKPFLLLGVGAEATALVGLRALAAAGAPTCAFLPVLGLMGLGMGVGMPNATVIIQNTAPRSQIGVATATMSFVRSLGGALGVALSGGLMAARLGEGLAFRIPGFDLRSIADAGLARIAALPPSTRTAVIEAYRHAIGFSLSVSAGAMLVALLLVITLPGGSLPDGRP